MADACMLMNIRSSISEIKHLKMQKSFKFHVKQCKSLCTYILDKLEHNIVRRYFNSLGDRSKSVERAWKELYRAVKETETYLKRCSTDEGRMKCFIEANTGEAFALHMHDLAWSLLCLDLGALMCPIQASSDRIHFKDFRNRLSDFCIERFSLCVKQFGFKLQDNWHLLMACNEKAAKGWTRQRKTEIWVLQFMERKILEAIRNECKIESATVRRAWLHIPPKHLIKKKIIGEGSFGTVYEGSWLGHKVAIKEISVDARDLFDKETAVLAKLQSPFIVQLIDTCIEGRHCYIVMELVSSSLDKLLENSGGRAPLALPVTVDIMLQISRGMEYLHSQEIIHMDLKASNVLIEPSAVPEFRKQGYGRVKVCDFGMASLRLSSFRCEDPKGTCYWRAPEAFPFPNEEVLPKIDCLNEYTYKADVYSFAMTCYEILTGKQPFLDVHPKNLYRMIEQGRRPILQPPSCPAVLADYIAECWETDPRRRPCFAQVSSFLRNMKLFIMRMDDPRGWRAKPCDYCYPHEQFKNLEYIEAAFDDIPVLEKQKLVAKVLANVPAEIKRSCDINVAVSESFDTNPFHLEDLSRKELLGDGSFGSTYRDQHAIFVFKILLKNTTYVGNERDFERGWQALGSLKHPNLVSLLGYFTHGDERLLVYNYLPQGSLHSLLHSMNWDRRMKIAADVAAGLEFLHESGFPHGNIKPSNILLDDDGNACLADSCLAMLLKNSHLAEKSSGYMAPEHSFGGTSEVEDVYSFGMLLLILVIGKDPLSQIQDLPTWILRVERERWRELLRVNEMSSEKRIQIMLGMFQVAMLCVYSRPRMRDVVEMIEWCRNAYLSSAA